MRWTMSSATLTTMSKPVPPRNWEIVGGLCSHALTADGITAISARRVQSGDHSNWLTALGVDFVQSFDTSPPVALDSLLQG